MSWYQYNPAHPPIKTWDEADAWIRSGRTPGSHRKLTKQRTLTRDINGDDIIFRLYAVDIITYHRDGTYTIRRDGSTTRTTIWDIQRNSPVTLASVPGTQLVEEDDWGRPRKHMWCTEWTVAHHTDRFTPSKIHKCRVCHGNRIVVSTCRPSRERPYRWHGKDEDGWPDREWALLPGNEWVTTRIPRPHEYDEGSYYDLATLEECFIPDDGLIPVPHERPRRDRGFAPCWHGFLEPHIEFNRCRNCQGTGRVEHGRKPIHYRFGEDDVLHITADGRVIRPIETWAGQIATLRQIRQRMRTSP